MCDTIFWVMGMIINLVIKSEQIRNERMIAEYENLISSLPKGSLICRKQEYYYLKYRENGKVCDKYVGKDMNLVNDIRNQLEKRKHYEAMLSRLYDERKAIIKIAEGLT